MILFLKSNGEDVFEFRQIIMTIIVLLALLLLVSGCSSAVSVHAPVTESITNEATTAAVTTQRPTPILTSGTTLRPTPEVTPEPTITIKPTPETTLEPTPEPTLKPTPEATPEPSTDSGKVVLAEGFYYIRLDDALKLRITGRSYPTDDTDSVIHYDDLRYIKLLYYDFDGNVHEGELMVHVKLADEVMEIFHELYKANYPLTSVRLVDDYGESGDDNLSMAANNTSAFNYRLVTGSDNLSRHSYGAAIDINPMLNPYITGDRIAPANGAAYADRSLDFAGKIDHDDLCYKLFIEHGWTWGGDWSGDKDYQHFSKDIGF